MDHNWRYYEQQALKYIHQAEELLERDDTQIAAADALLNLAAENMLRAAKCGPSTERERFVAAAEDILQHLESPDAAAPGAEDADVAWQVIRDTGVRLNDVAGLAEAKEQMYNMAIRPMIDPDGARKWKKKIGGGLLLYGPPGTGKTMFAKAVAGELDAVFMNVVGSSLLSKWVGDAEKNISALFREAARHERCVLFIDEAEMLIPVRGKGSTVMDRVTPAFLAAMDGITGRQEGLLLLGATNRPDAMDPAALRKNRFEYQIYIGLPEYAARLAIIEHEWEGVPMDDQVDARQLARDLEGYSGADISLLCGEATASAWTREEQDGEVTILHPEDVAHARKKVRASVSPDDLKVYRKFEQGWRGKS